MKTGDIAFVKSIEVRQPVSVREDKNGKETVRANRFGVRFQSEQNLLSEVGVFLFLGKMPETWQLADDGGAQVQRHLERRMADLGWFRATRTELVDEVVLEIQHELTQWGGESEPAVVRILRRCLPILAVRGEQ